MSDGAAIRNSSRLSSSSRCGAVVVLVAVAVVAAVVVAVVVIVDVDVDVVCACGFAVLCRAVLRSCTRHTAKFFRAGPRRNARGNLITGHPATLPPTRL